MNSEQISVKFSYIVCVEDLLDGGRGGGAVYGPRRPVAVVDSVDEGLSLLNEIDPDRGGVMVLKNPVRLSDRLAFLTPEYQEWKKPHPLSAAAARKSKRSHRRAR